MEAKMAEQKYRMKISVKNPSASNSVLSVLSQDPDVESVDLKSSLPADLMILELDGTDRQIVEKIELLLESKAAGELLLLSENSAPDLLMRLMRIGVKEFLPLPLNEQEFKIAIDRFKARAVPGGSSEHKKNGRVISVIGSKGRVGTTTVAVNLGVFLAGSRKETSVALLDMNTLFGEIPLFLDLAPRFHWGEITKNLERLDQTFLMNILSRHQSGVHLLPSPSYLNGNNMPTLEVIDRLLGLMRSMFDYVVVDAGQSLVDSNLRALQHSDQVFLISLLNMPCLSNTNRLIKSLTELGCVSKEQVKVVINRYLKKSEITVKDAQAGIGSEIFCLIPNDYRTTMAAINQGKPIREVAPNSPVAETFQEMTRSLLPQTNAPKMRKWRLFGRG
jgi:pilus assembly protein CpaE